MSNKNQTELIRGREKSCDEKLKKKKTTNRITQNGVIKNIIIYQSKVYIYIYIYMERERERENKIRRRGAKIKDIVMTQTPNYLSHTI